MATEITRLPNMYRDTDHVIVLVTHAALLRADFRDFAGWEIIIDEVPQIVDFEEKTTHLDEQFFRRLYKLKKLSRGWSAVTLSEKGRTVSAADVRADQSHAHMSVFHSRVIEASVKDSKRVVLTNLQSWREMAGRKVKWCWASVFSLRNLEAFDRVELLGNRFRQDVGALITQFVDGSKVQWKALPPLCTSRTFVHRDVHIGYFSDRPSARSYFESEAGKRTLEAIGKHLATVLPKGNSIWSANDPAGGQQPSPKSLLGLPEGDYLGPRQAGTNQYQSINYAAIIYAAKPSSNLRSLLKLFDIDVELWTRSVEHETILQFVTRTSVRDPSNPNLVLLWVYDRDQADYLKSYFDQLPHVTATVEREPVDLDIPQRSKGGRPAIVRTPEEQRVHEARMREKDRLRKRKARERAKRA